MTQGFFPAARGLAGAALSAFSLALLLPGAAQAQGDAWPSRSIKIVVGYAPGGPSDITARLLAPKLTAALGQPVIVENKAGAGSNLAFEYVAAAAPDGYTLLLAAAPIVMNNKLYKNLKYDPVKSFEPVINVMTSPSVLAVAPNLPVQNLQQFIALAKKEPGRLTYSSSGNGGTQHLAGELLEQRAGLDMIHVPYRGAAPALNDLVAGQVSAGFQTAMGALVHLKNNAPRPIAVASTKRLPQLPNVPTFAESGLPDVVVESWNGMFAPAGTPQAIVNRLNAEVNKALASPDIRDNFENSGAYGVGGTPAEFKRYVAEEVDRWGKLMKSTNISLD
ncbi:MAG: tripartite tricarboxylate transporter substrate binding protein [Pseudomonadota bacterium]